MNPEDVRRVIHILAEAGEFTDTWEEFGPEDEEELVALVFEKMGPLPPESQDDQA